MKNMKFLITPLLAGLLAVTGGQAFAADQTAQRGQGQKMGQQQQGQSMKQKWQERRDMKKGRNQDQRKGAKRNIQGNMPAFADFDLNGDGKITEAEFTEARTVRISQRAQEGRQMRGLTDALSFEELDTNGDGSISPAEFAAAKKLHQQQSGKQQGRRGSGQGRGQ